VAGSHPAAGQIAAGDHHSGVRAAHRGEQNRGQIFERLGRLDLEDDAEPIVAGFVRRRQQVIDVAWCPDERDLDEIGARL
jgi:hypothetical protein